MSSTHPISSSNQFYLGGTGGTFRPIEISESGDKKISFYFDKVIDAILIDNKTYGGDGRTLDKGKVETITLPSDAYFTLTALIKRRLTIHDKPVVVVSYIEAEIDGKQVKVGDSFVINSYGMVESDTWTGSEKVAIVGIQCGTLVNGILFQKASQ